MRDPVVMFPPYQRKKDSGFRKPKQRLKPIGSCDYALASLTKSDYAYV